MGLHSRDVTIFSASKTRKFLQRVAAVQLYPCVNHDDSSGLAARAPLPGSRLAADKPGVMGSCPEPHLKRENSAQWFFQASEFDLQHPYHPPKITPTDLSKSSLRPPQRPKSPRDQPDDPNNQSRCLSARRRSAFPARYVNQKSFHK